MKQGWEIKKLGEVFDLQMGKTPSRDNGDYWGGDNVWVAISDLQDKYIGESKEHITDKALTETKIKKVKAGTTIMSFKLSVGRAAITTQDLYTNEAIMAFNLNEGYDLIADYIYYYLKGYKWQGANKAVMGLTLNKASISQNHIAIPPREEQERIVAELDCLSGVIEKKREQLRELDALAQSIFYTMFGDPITNEKGWEVKKLGEVCDIYRGGSPRPIEQYLGGNIPWIKIGDAVFGTDIYLTKTKEHIIEEGLKKTRFIHSGSLIFANCGVSLGFARIITFDGCIHDGWLAFDNISNAINKIFLLKSLNFCTQYFRETAPDGTQPNLNTGIMKAFAQIIPPLALQQEFADKIEAIEKQKALIKQSITQTETLFNARMAYYFN